MVDLFGATMATNKTVRHRKHFRTITYDFKVSRKSPGMIQNDPTKMMS